MNARIRIPLIAVVLLGAAGPVAPQIQEIFSKWVQVFNPIGAFPQLLIKNAPASGEGWREVKPEKDDFRMLAPDDALLDTTPREARLVHVVLAGGPQRPRPVFRVDRFTPDEGDPTAVDQKAAIEYAETYGEEQFDGKFSVGDSGMLLLGKKHSLAMVGGSYLQGAVRCYRLQCVYLARDRKLFITFDCQESDWAKHAPVVARMLLSMDLGKR
jgi:hypothetical protein